MTDTRFEVRMSETLAKELEEIANEIQLNGDKERKLVSI